MKLKLITNTFIALFNKLILRKSNGYVVKKFATNMGLAYIKLAQMLAMQNIDNLFTEKDRRDIMDICDNCNPIPYKNIKEIIMHEYGERYKEIFHKIYTKPLGSASISQVHKAILKDGRQVVIKVKRQDIQDTVDRDVNTIRFLSKTFGKLFNINNYIGSNKALEFYQQWLKLELNFENEAKNIKMYSNFAKSVNGQVRNCVDIEVPKIYEEFCTSNIIVMEYIAFPTINHNMDREKIIKGVNSYIQLSFYALLHEQSVVWHGDPHAGNIYITDKGNIGFLDMGLIFELSEEDAKNTKELFFNVYFGRYDNLYNTLIPYFKGTEQQKLNFKNDIKEYCNTITSRPVTAFFMDMVLICIKYSISPPDFLYGMAKAFVCLGGLDTVYENNIHGHDLLLKQVNEYIGMEILKESKNMLGESIKLTKGILKLDRDKIIDSISKYGISINKLKNIV